MNRMTRRIDHLCHLFVARHLPSAGHLRFISATLRLDVELERVGDYAVSIAREAVQLSEPPTSAIARDIEMMAEQVQAVLHDAIRAFLDSALDYLAIGDFLIEGPVGSMATRKKWEGRSKWGRAVHSSTSR